MTLKLQRVFLNSVFDILDFTPQQIKEIELGLEQLTRVDYINPNISAENMKKMRLNNGKIKLYI